jgi:DNA-3-methyladenine glycosylase II
VSGPREVLGGDPVLARLLERYGLPELTPAADPFCRLCVSIINQSVSTASARAVRERAFEHLGEVTPDSVLAAEQQALRETGLSAAKVEYLRAAAEAFAGRDYPAALEGLDDEAAIAELTDIRGIGDWTARMFLLFALGREDVLPLGDLALRRSLEELYGLEDRTAMREQGEAWRPYRSYATLLLWKQYEDDADAPLV